ncbi:MAG: hypothetical protein KDH20_12930 [Rhodocyclaceae bacterium]|nr:hypothetical protein [Rhodocyclaceae bacterium]
MRIALVTALVLPLSLPTLALAAGSEDTKPPKPTQTTETCTGTQVWDEKTQKCVNPKKSDLGTDALVGAVRELAYAGRLDDAQGVLAAIADQSDDRVLTYWGFTHRKLGHTELANAFYLKALAKNPDNLLARSYMGQGFVAEGRVDDAIAQWREIRARGGEGTWAEASLRESIRSGITYSY